MVYFLIDDSYIIESKINNSSYFFNKGLIPINISYKLSKIPYYENSRYYYRDLIEFIKNNDLKKKPKPINKTSRLNTIYYNPKKTKGKIISYEYIPINIEKYNLVPENSYIKYIYIWNKYGEIKMILKKINLLDCFFEKIDKINLILEDSKKTILGYRTKWIPKSRILLNNTKFIDFSEFINKSNFLMNIVLENIF